jgi:hypothetical protein
VVFVRRYWLAGAALVAFLLAWFLLWNKAPQMGPSADAFRTVDALFTAVTARDEKLLAGCEQRLQALADAGELPGAALDYLSGITQHARAGHWQSAAVRLYDFMMAQRREGTSRQPAKPH